MTQLVRASIWKTRTTVRFKRNVEETDRSTAS